MFVILVFESDYKLLQYSYTSITINQDLDLINSAKASANTLKDF